MIVEIPSKDIQVGDVLYITENEEIPSDCVVLYSSNPNGICYIQVVLFPPHSPDYEYRWRDQFKTAHSCSFNSKETLLKLRRG